MRYTENRKTTTSLEKVLGYILILISIGKLTALNTTNIITLLFDIIVVFIVIGFGISFISSKQK